MNKTITEMDDKVSKIIDIISKKHNITQSEALTKSRKKNVMNCRKEIILQLYFSLNLKPNEIGEIVNTDRTNVIYHINCFNNTKTLCDVRDKLALYQEDNTRLPHIAYEVIRMFQGKDRKWAEKTLRSALKWPMKINI